MVLEHEILPYMQWLLGGAGSLGALPRFLLVMLGMGLLALLGGYIMAAARHGFLRGGDIVYRTVSSGFRELLEMSPRRIGALARLAVKESWRRRVVVALVVFFVILLFASWFLKTDHQDPAKLYISFVLTATTYLVLGVALLLSAFSLPNDFRTKTIYTVVTKPVRSGEIILGRIIGFTIVGTILLAVMALCSYVFVIRSLGHTHRLAASDLRHADAAPGGADGYVGRTSLDSYHRHEVDLDADKQGEAILNHGHFHRIESDGDQVHVLKAEGLMRARVPQWGKLTFKDRQGVDKLRGISVGTEWTYRSFIDGNSQAAAIWTFDHVDESVGADGLPIGLIVRVFRTHKGVIGRAISGTIQVRNPATDLLSEADHFFAEDAKVDERIIPRNINDADGVERDLYKDFVSDDGKIEVIIQCLERGQYFGFAQPDCYLSLPDASGGWNYVKVYISIWVQMVIVTSIGVAASALLTGPIAMMFTVSFILLGFFRDFFVSVALDTVYGGGPVESLVRIVTQRNVMSAIDPSPGVTLMKGIDNIFQGMMWSVAQVLPDFSSFSTVDFAAFGFNVPNERVMQDLTTCLAYVASLAVVGYFLLRTREVAK